MFYKRLWDIIQNPLFPTTEAHVFALYHMLIDVRLPYFKLDDGLRMSDDQFRKEVQRLHDSRSKLRFIFYAPDIEQKSEKAEYLY